MVLRKDGICEPHLITLRASRENGDAAMTTTHSAGNTPAQHRYNVFLLFIVGLGGLLCRS
jgi:hypothetical protein